MLGRKFWDINVRWVKSQKNENSKAFLTPQKWHFTLVTTYFLKILVSLGEKGVRFISIYRKSMSKNFCTQIIWFKLIWEALKNQNFTINRKQLFIEKNIEFRNSQHAIKGKILKQKFLINIKSVSSFLNNFLPFWNFQSNSDFSSEFSEYWSPLVKFDCRKFGCSIP